MPAAQAVEVLIHEYYKLVFHTIYGLTNNWEESQDLTQDTFHQALKGIDAARASSKGHFQAKAWLLRIALNSVRMQRRRRALFSFIPFSTMRVQRSTEGGEQARTGEDVIHDQATPVQPGGYASTETVDPAELIAEQDVVQRTMAQLPEGLRECLLLSIVGGLSSLEIAKLLEIKEVAVRQRLARARKQFQQLYTRESGEEIVNNTAPAATSLSASYGNQERKQGQQRPDKRQHLSLATPPPSLWSGYV